MNIKKLLCLILALLILACTSLVACSDDDNQGPVVPSGPEFENSDFPDELMSLDEYIEAPVSQKEEYRDSFGSSEAFLKWFQEAYRLSGKKGAISSKTGYMDGFDKSGFPSVVLTWEEYCDGDGYGKNGGYIVQTAYYKAFSHYSDFSRWSNEAKRIYEEEQNREEIGDSDIEIDLSK